MTEWIVAPLLAADPTSRPVYRPGESDAAAVAKPEPAADDRRGTDRREPHVDTDDDFGRGEDRRDSTA
ncbi:MAG TPA: hypothetical protein DDZ22_05840 [Massilia sp.]|nr:hypothetical protein [Massilia sp.]